MSQKESEWDIAQIARERVKNEAFYKDEDGKNCLDLTKTREIIQDAISQREKEIVEEVEKLKRYDLGDDGACGDPECCGPASYTIEETEDGDYLERDEVLQVIKH